MTTNLINKKSDKLLRLYTTIITISGLAVIGWALTNLPEDYFGLLIFAILAVIAELGSVELFVTSRQSHVSVSSIIAIASILLFGPFAGALTHTASGLITILTTTPKHDASDKGRVDKFRRTLFNVGMFTIAAATAGCIYTFFGGVPGKVNQAGNIFPLITAVIVATVTNLAILIGVIALQTGGSPFQIWRDNFQWAAPIAIIGGIIGGGVLALAYELFSFLGLAVFFLPILATSYSFRLYTNNMRGYVNKLEEANSSLEKANLGLLETMGAIIDAYDVYTYGHSTQVANYVAAICEKMDMPQKEKTTIIKAALVHDIGKVGIVDEIVGKPGPLTIEENNIMKRHPVIGAEILGRMEEFHELVPLVRHHHERWDGRGYPDGLDGTNIPLGARVLAVADTADAILSDRPYRPTRTLKELVNEIRRFSGIQFDPIIADIFISITQEKTIGFFKNSAATVDQTLRVNETLKIGSNGRYLKKSMIRQ